MSVHDSGKWIADLDILHTFESPYLIITPPCDDPLHDAAAYPSEYQMTSIENWLTLVDEVDEHINLVQAHGNWEARLAATAISIAKGHLTFVHPEKLCWECCIDEISESDPACQTVIVIM